MPGKALLVCACQLSEEPIPEYSEFKLLIINIQIINLANGLCRLACLFLVSPASHLGANLPGK